MKTKNNLISNSKDILLNIEAVAGLMKESKFTRQSIVKLKIPLTVLTGFFDCNDEQAILFSIICNLNLNRQSVDVEDIAHYIDCPPITILKYMKELEGLCSMKLLRREYDDSRSRRRRKSGLNQIKFAISNGVVEAIINGEKFTPHRTENLDVYELLETVKGLMDDRDNGRLTFDDMAGEIKLVLADNEKQEWIRKLTALNLIDDDLFLLLFLCYEFTTGNESVDLSEAVKLIFPGLHKQLEIRKEILHGFNDLVRFDLATLEDGMFMSDRSLKLTDRSIDMFIQEDKKLFLSRKEKKKPDIILSGDIIDKNLYYNETEEQKLDFLTDVLLPDHFSQLTSRLGDAGMKKGVAILFYGPPGTGKTESVYQIARKTGRDIKMVVISETKSMWFGESEKLIKGIFDKYRRLVENSKEIPILLFNEADGIFGSRKQVGNSAVHQTENAIQNIILQEMEDLNGILIATTNLTQNLDSAFERRFLYKIRFDAPSIDAKTHIWKDKIPALTESEAMILARGHDLSGGQIDNIARKYLLRNILYGSNPDLSELESYCREERLEQGNYSRIGFRR